MRTPERAPRTTICSLTALAIGVFASVPAAAEPTTIRIDAMPGIGYSVDWVTIDYRDAAGHAQVVRRDKHLPAAQYASFTLPDGATNIVLEARPLGSLKKTRIFNNLALASGGEHCFELRGSVNHPRYDSVVCGWEPRGRVYVFDDTLNTNVGLKRVKIEVKKDRGTSTIGTTYTDDNGHFALGQSVRGKVHYKVVFEDAAGLKIKYGANSHAESVKFDAMEGSLNHVFRTSDRTKWYWATLYNAAQFYKDYARRDNIPVKSDAQLCFYYETGISRTPMTGVQDVVFRKYNKNSRDIFDNVMHEMAHVTHATVDRNAYASFMGSWGLRNTLRAAYGESWACGPQAIFTRRRYDPTHSELGSYQDHDLARYTYPDFADSGEHLYIRPIVVDLMDTNNQHAADNARPVDRVSGYTLQQIANALRDAHDLDDWKNNLKRVNNPTNVYLDEYFNQYFEGRAVRTASNTIIKIKAVSGVGYSVEWVDVSYTDASGKAQSFRRTRKIPLGQEATITVPDGASDIRIEAKPYSSLKKTRIFNNLALPAGVNHCFDLKGSVNKPRYDRVDCGS